MEEKMFHNDDPILFFPLFLPPMLLYSLKFCFRLNRNMKFFDEFGAGVRKQRSVFNETTWEKNFLQFLKSFSLAFNYFLTDMAVRETYEFD